MTSKQLKEIEAQLSLARKGVLAARKSGKLIITPPQAEQIRKVAARNRIRLSA